MSPVVHPHSNKIFMTSTDVPDQTPGCELLCSDYNVFQYYNLCGCVLHWDIVDKLRINSWNHKLAA